jgi:phosphoserine phosphatase
MTKVLFVDLCHTLVPENTTTGFIEFLLGDIKSSHIISFKSSFTMRLLSKALFVLFKYDLIRTIYLYKLKGLTKEEIYSAAESYVSTLNFNRVILAEIEGYKKRGYKVLLLSASIDPVVSSVCSHLNISTYESSKLSYNEQVSTGGLARDLLDAKLGCLVEYAGSNKKIAFITDNHGDYSCINHVDDFIAVIPCGFSASFWNNKSVSRLIRL